MKKFIYRNDGFVCENCGFEVKPAAKTCRNHCPACLCSKHLDLNPGDRAAHCGGLMIPVLLELKSGLPDRLVHECTICGQQKPNKILDEDNRTKMFELKN